MTELITNGAFDTDTSGWSAQNATLSAVSGRLRVSTTGTTSAIGYQSFATVVGQIYRVIGEMFLGTGTNVTLSIGIGPGSIAIASISGAGTKTFLFSASATTTYVRCQVPANNSGRYLEADNISVQPLPPRKPARSSFFLG